MFRRLVLTCLPTLLAVFGFIDRGWAQTQSLPTRSALARLGLERNWSTAVPIGISDEKVTRFNVAGPILFVQTNRGHAHAYDAESGRYLWGVRLDVLNSNPMPGSVNSEFAFLTVLKTLYAMHRGTGQLVWKVEMEDLASTGTFCDEETVAVGLRSGKIVAFNVLDHSQDTPPGRSAGTFAWGWQTGGPVSSRPVVGQRVVAFASQDHRVYVAQKGDGVTKSEMIFRYRTGGPISASLAIHGNRTLIVPSGDYNVYAIDLFSGATRWTVPTSAPVDQEPLVAGDDVLAINKQGRLMAIDARDGSVRWDVQTDGKTMLALSPTRVYVANPHLDVIIFDRATGQMIASARDTLERAGFNNRELSLSFPNYQNDRLYFSSPAGMLFSVRELGRTAPAPLRDPKLPEFGTVPPEGLPEENATTGAVPAPTGEPAPDAEPKDQPDNDSVPDERR